jgi:hypothetical protein
MPQDQTPDVPTVARAGLARMIADGHVKAETVQQDQVPPLVQTAAPRFQFVPDAAMRHIGDAVREWTYQAIKAVAGGGRIDWDVSLGLAPAGNGSFVSAYILLIYMPSILINQPPLGVVRIIPDLPDQDQVRQAVLSAVGEIKDQQNAMMKPHG